jgi:hypothetical protein
MTNSIALIVIHPTKTTIATPSVRMVYCSILVCIGRPILATPDFQPRKVPNLAECKACAAACKDCADEWHKVSA